jgi:bifunctional non-homologous end joining protein LigD
VCVIPEGRACSLCKNMTRATCTMISGWKSAECWFPGPVPKGPTLDPSSKRFAIMTEDHPIDYAGFEGVIPERHYGAGTVMIWYKGTYQTQGDAAAEDQLAEGELKIELHGKKLRGAFVLVHMGHRSGTPQERSRWLLVKRKDEWANSRWKADRRGTDRSVTSGRTLDEIARAHASGKRAA